ncbi:MAG TPA: S-layer protein [Methanomicrobia archaeon]|nr:S-layer protein [Methanomicrobia archaeon]
MYGDYASGSPHEGDGPYQVYDPATNRWEIYSANDENRVVAFCTKEMPAYNACAERTGDLLTLESDYDATYKGEVVFAIRITKSMIAASGARMVEYTVYALDDYGVLTEQIYPSPCEQPIEPTIRVNELEWYLDIFPADNIDSNDLDNDISLFVEGNPNFDAADAIALEYGASKCYPMLELWLATPVESETMCSEELLVELRDCNGDNYFCVNINDGTIADYRIDEYIGIFKKRYYLPTVTTYAADIDVESLVTTDNTIPEGPPHTKNLVLVGGPMANDVVAKLAEEGKTSYYKWIASEGDVEFLEKEANKGILIVAGKDRNATLNAALDLVDSL